MEYSPSLTPALLRLLVHLVFFLSGFAAVLYQLLWQRALLTAYGTGPESVAAVVTAFMIGLGVGSLAGGALSAYVGSASPIAFALMEIGIGAFGYVSIPLIHWVARLTPSASFAGVALISIAILLLPTFLMGATLPVLVAFFIRRSASVGRSLGDLYSVNTLGSAVGAAAGVLVIFGAFGERGAIVLAAATNLLAGTAILAIARKP